MELKEEIQKRAEAGFNKKEIISFLTNKGYAIADIEKEFPKLERTNSLYVFVLTISTITALTSFASAIIFSLFLSLVGVISLTAVYGAYLIYKLEKAGFIIHIVFNILLICGVLLGFIFYREGAMLSPIFSIQYLILFIALFSFVITSLFKLYRKV